MQTQISQLKNGEWIQFDTQELSPNLVQLVLVFGERFLLEDSLVYAGIKEKYPNATVVTGSTSGEICNTGVFDDTVVTVAMYFEKTSLSFSKANINSFSSTYDLGKFVANALPKENLKYVLVISDGGKVNGTELTAAINEVVGDQVLVTGGLAGDKARFEKTIVGLNEDIAEGNVVLVGMYGEHIKVGCGLRGGWDMFGPERVITKASQNVLFEIDHVNALELYKKYLGKYAADLPGSALLFPLAIKSNNEENQLVRTILSIDEEKQSMTFAGNMPEGARVRLMKANFDKLIFSAGEAATDAENVLGTAHADFVLLISCVGRKLVLGSRTEEEVEAAAEVFGAATKIAGFYSYGEISPQQFGTCSDLHNQTMTITTFTEL
ncbi:FIST signal transduction protein [Limnovirga soli]|uniref:Histidine kinase n=1 Tax=Limnovirga soli TaxID=2656915 RepID=A0A8J8FHI6_9BACT|nr:FIST N-terminal domain-containing protein [Limnovirga soli]NNV56474.1 histidine kinase [Limnovirga soli]